MRMYLVVIFCCGANDGFNISSHQAFTHWPLVRPYK